MSLFGRKVKVGDIISENGTTTAIGYSVKSRGGYTFAMTESIKTNELMEDLKQMVDFIIDNGYTITTRDFRSPVIFSVGGKVFTDITESLKDDLKDITIYKNDDISKTYEYIKGKYDSLKKLISIQDGSIFSKESNELFDYIENKSKK